MTCSTCGGHIHRNTTMQCNIAGCGCFGEHPWQHDSLANVVSCPVRYHPQPAALAETCGCGHIHPAGAVHCYVCDLPLGQDTLADHTDAAVRVILGA